MGRKIWLFLALLLGLGASWCQAAAAGPPPAPAHLRPAREESKHFIIESNLPKPFPEAILRLCETNLDGYKSLFGLDLHPSIAGGDTITGGKRLHRVHVGVQRMFRDELHSLHHRPALLVANSSLQAFPTAPVGKRYSPGEEHSRSGR